MIEQTLTSEWFEVHQDLLLQACHELPGAQADLGQGLCRALSNGTSDFLELAQPYGSENLSGLLKDAQAVQGALRRAVVAQWLAEQPAPAANGASLLSLLDYFEATTAPLWANLEAALATMSAKCDRFEIVAQIARDLTKSFDLEHSVQIATGLADALQADRIAFLILDRESDRFFSWAERNLKLPPLDVEALPDEWQRGWGAHILLPGSEGEHAWLRTYLGQAGSSYVAAIPLNTGGSLYGILIVARNQRPFEDEELDLALSVASQVSAAVSNAEVFRLLNTQAHQLGEMLREHENEASKSRAILRSIADGVIVNNPHNKIILMNPAAERMIGLRQGEAAHLDVRTLLKTFEPGGRDEALAALEYISAHPEAEEASGLTTILASGQRVISARMAPVSTPQDEFLGVVTILRDITKEVEADRAKSEFVSTVSHELRTPMTAIKGYTDLLHAGTVGAINEGQKRFLGIIKSNAERLTALINDLLDISRIETGRIRFEPGPVQLGDVAAEVVEALGARAAEKDHELTYQVAPGVPAVQGDKDRLVQVLTNLVGNAINYTPNGGKINIEVSTTAGAVQVDVSDTGVGIAPEELGKIFDRFYRGESPLVLESAGTGLGLSIVKMFVEMHGGRLWVRSKPNEGSIFTFILPTSGAEPGPKPEAPSRQTVATGHILAIEDDAAVGELLTMLLENQGYEVTLAPRGALGIEAARRQPVDLILLDMLLPDMNGLEILAELKQDDKIRDIPVLIVTIVEDEGKAFELGAAGYVLKPIDEDILLEQIKMALIHQGRVLIVEDDRDTALLLERGLRQVGFATQSALDGYEALVLARRNRPDVILLDLHLPGMDGYEALTHLKRDASTQDIPIIALSAHVDDGGHMRRRLTELGAVALLTKPLDLEAVVRAVERTITVELPRTVDEAEAG